uniref:Uncharacterized protein n=1 Tax=Alexandrium andersonii TaxID=327968 RepID=A0A7S2N2U7_9DINO
MDRPTLAVLVVAVMAFSVAAVRKQEHMIYDATSADAALEAKASVKVGRSTHGAASAGGSAKAASAGSAVAHGAGNATGSAASGGKPCQKQRCEYWLKFNAGMGSGDVDFAKSIELQEGFPKAYQCSGKGGDEMTCCQEQYKGYIQGSPVSYDCRRLSWSFSSMGFKGLFKRWWNQGNAECECEHLAVGKADHAVQGVFNWMFGSK